MMTYMTATSPQTRIIALRMPTITLGKALVLPLQPAASLTSCGAVLEQMSVVAA